MSLVGNLEDLPLADILQIVSLSKRTGILTIETEEGKNIVVFKNGLIVSASCPSPQIKNLGQILLERQIITQTKLQQLLDLQKTRGNEPLGSLLLESKITDKETLQQIIKNQIKETIYHLMQRREGNFSFDLSEVIPFDEIRYNPLETVLERGLNPQQLLLDSVRISDEQTRDEQRGKVKQVDFYSDMDIPVKVHAEESFADLPDETEPVEHAVKLEDLQLPETSDLPDIAFDQIANQIDFPIASSATATTVTPIHPTQPAVAVTTQRSILLVDDEALIRQVIAKRFSEKGFNVHQTDNAKDAIRMAGEAIAHREDLGIVCDLVMPTSIGSGFLGGLEVVEAVRRLDSTIPILMITDYDDPKAQTRAFSLGVHNFHKKPVLGKYTIQDAEAHLSQFADSLLDAFQLPPHQFKTAEIQDDFWSDLGIEQTPKDDAPASAANMIRQMTALREIIQQLRNPNEAPEISLLILRYAAEFFDRGLLFLVKKDEVDGLGGFGDTGEAEPMPQKVRRIKIPLAEDSVFSRVVKRRQTHIGKLSDTTTNRRFISMTGRLVPPAVAMLPLISGTEVIALLYGDNASTKRPIKDLEGLEIFMVQAGIAMENALLHRKIKTLKFK